MKPLIRQAIRRHRTTWLVYAAIGIGLLLLYVAIYPSIQAQQAALDNLLKSFPQSILQAFGATSSSLDSLAGLLVSKQYGLIWPLMAAFLAIGYAADALAGETDNGTIGIVLALPISRRRIVGARLIAGLIGLAVFVITTVAVINPVAAAFGATISPAAVFKFTILCFLFATSIMTTALLVSAAANSRGRVYAVVGMALLIMYVANLVSLLVNSLNWLKFGSVFYYFDAMGTLSGNHLSWAAVLVFAAISVVTGLAAFVAFDRRDLSV